MAASNDHVVRHARRNLGPVVAYGLLAIATAVALYLGATAKDESGDVAALQKQAGPPCVDEDPGPGITPSEGCKLFYAVLSDLCARNPDFCAESQQEAVKRAQARATDREIGPLAALDNFQGDEGQGGGGGSPGNRPDSPGRPSPQPPGGGQGGGGDGQPDNPPPTTEQPQPEPEPEPPPAETQTDILPVDPPLKIEDPTLCRIVDPLTGQLIRLC
jgi:hypothetical protein